MALIVPLVGVLIVMMSVVSLASPCTLIKLVGRVKSPARFWFAVLRRALLGTVFLAVAPDCRVPAVVQVVGWLSILGAVFLLMLGRSRLDASLEWWLISPTLIRVTALIAIAGGALLIFAGPVMELKVSIHA